METPIEIRVRFFGAFRDLFRDQELLLQVSPKSLISDLKSEITRIAQENAKKWNNSPVDILALVSRSAFADEKQVLRDHDQVHQGMELAILPPVCGG